VCEWEETGRECPPPQMEGGQKLTEMKADFGIPHSWCIKCRSEQSLTVHYPAPRISMLRMCACACVCVCVCVRGGMALSSSSRSQKLELSQCISVILSIPGVSLHTYLDEDDSDVCCWNIVMRSKVGLVMRCQRV
jgi:hypothetical protein